MIAEHPKAFLGYSDITALHVALRQRARLATFYGPHLWTVGAKDTSELTRRRRLEVLTSGAGPVPRDPDDPYVRPIRGGPATGPLVGGDLWLLLQTMGRHGRWSWRGRSCCDWSGPSRWSRSWRSTWSRSACRSSTSCRSAKHLATLPLGVAATLDADASTLTVDQPALRPAAGGG